MIGREVRYIKRETASNPAGHEIRDNAGMVAAFNHANYRGGDTSALEVVAAIGIMHDIVDWADRFGPGMSYGNTEPAIVDIVTRARQATGRTNIPKGVYA